MALLQSDEKYFLEPVFVEHEQYDFESGKLDLDCSGNCPRVTTKYAKKGKYSMESTLNDSRRNIFRTEAILPEASRTMIYGTDYWIGFSVYLPQGWEVPNKFEILAQVHRSNPTGQPPLAFYTGSGEWKISSRWAGGRKDWTLNSVYEDVGRWTDFVIHYRPSDSSDGILEVWKDGALVARKTGRNTIRDDTGPYFKIGLYRSRDIKAAKTVYHDELRFASGPAARYADVAPR
jgi:hypothetical protein